MIRIGLAVALVAVSCGSAEPGLVIPVADNGWGRFTLVVVDDSGLVTGARPRANERGGAIEVTAWPERQELDLEWLGGACAHKATIRVAGTSADLSLALQIPQEAQLPFTGCPSIGIPLAATLSLSEPVADEAITFEVAR